MKANESFKTINNKFLEDYALSDKDIANLKVVIINILRDVNYTLRKNNVFFASAFGTTLGAVRHHGLIPWDDDIDIYMFRKDLKILGAVLDKEFPDKYAVSLPGDNKYDPCRFAKIMLKNTTYVEIEYSGLPWDKGFWRGISIDVFILDYVPKNKLLFKIKDMFNKIYCVAATSSREYKYPAPQIIEISKRSVELKQYYNKRRLIGFFFSLLSIRAWVKLWTKNIDFRRANDYVSIGVSTYSYSKYRIETKYMIDTIDVEFDDFKVPVFRCYDQYLTTCYGDWKTIPAETNREKHILYKIDFGEYKI